MNGQESFLTDEQQGRLNETKKWKKGDIWITPKKPVLKDGWNITGEFIEKKEVKRPTGDFSSYIFKDYVFGDYVYLTGANLVQYEKEKGFAKGNYYDITFNGMAKTQADHDFKSFTIINVTPQVNVK